MKTSIGNDFVLKIGLGMAKIGTLQKFDLEHVENRLAVLEELASFGKVFVDTSPIYGSGFSENILSNILAKNREKYYIATKYFPENSHTAKDLIDSVENSINRMKVDQIDLLQIHWPNPLANLNQILKGFSSLKNNQLVKNIGLCNFTNNEIEELSRNNPEIEFVSNQVELHIGNMNRMLSRHSFSAPKIIAYGSILQGRYAFSKEQRSQLMKSANDYCVSPAALAILILMYKFEDCLPVLKISSTKHLTEILQVFSFSRDLFDINQDLQSLKSEISFVDPEEITLSGDEFRKPYLTFNEARKNTLQLFPSPVSLAQRIRQFNIVLPVKVASQVSGKFLVDPYDPFDQVKKFWAWRLAYPNEKIPIDIIE
jgi:diketogulonate reductase-like aldo/keto reductase